MKYQIKNIHEKNVRKRRKNSYTIKKPVQNWFLNNNKNFQICDFLINNKF